jgi:ABC-type Na+ efflux pump permease subunit
MSGSLARTRAVVRKELAEFRRNRFIVLTTALLPLVFLVSPTASILLVHGSAGGVALGRRIDDALFLPLLIPVFVPSLMSAYAVIGERDQDTLEPALTTPLRVTELLAGKAVAIFLPAIVVSYLMFGAFVGITQVAGSPAVAAAVRHAPQLVAGLVFIPLLAGWAIWVGLAISATVSETRVAQQLGILSSLPPVALTALMSFRIISPAFWVAAVLAGVLLAVDVLGCFLVARLFDTERLVTGSRATAGPGAVVPGPTARSGI